MCNCGKIRIVRGQSLRSGLTTSCGCKQKEIIKNIRPTHGMSKSRLFRIWDHMNRRCSDYKATGWKHYGGRGVIVCPEWHEFIPFMKWAMANGYTENLEIDRIDNDGNYEPSNCRWVTRAENNRNKRRKSA